MESTSHATPDPLIRLHGYFSMMSPAEYIGCDGADPEHGPWEAWCAGRTPEVPDQFALFAWWQFCAALDCFICPIGGSYPEYIIADDQSDHMSPATAERFDALLVHHLRKIECLRGRPLDLISRFEELDFWPDEQSEECNPISLASAYSLWCLDQGILALHTKNASLAAAAFAYAMSSLELGQSYQQQIKTDSPSAIVSAMRAIGSKGGLAKRERSAKTPDKAFVKACWQRWRENPQQYKTKVAFASDMLDKCENLTSQKVIEGRCRDWEKESM